jgi:shikimate kinase
MNIILLGYRGSGKSSIGKKIAAATWKDFIDTDDRTRRRFDGRSVADIWATDGEPAYRQVEVEETEKALREDNAVIALGGGTVMQDAARRAVAEATDTIRIYLACKPAVLAQRIAADPATAGTRPALTQGATSADDLEEITAVLAQRDPVYRELADVVFDASYVDIDQAAAYLQRHHL